MRVNAQHAQHALQSPVRRRNTWLTHRGRHLHRVAAVALVMLATGRALAAQQPPAPNRPPTVGVMTFTNAAMVRREEFAPISMAMAELLSGQLAANPAIAVVERAQLDKVLAELGLARSGTVDAATAAQLGKLLGAQYMLFGVLVVDPSERMRLDVRAVDVSTSRVLSRHSVNDRDANDVMRLVDRLAAELHTTLRLPGVQPPPVPASKEVDRDRQRRALVSLARGLIAERSPAKSDSARVYFREALAGDERMMAARRGLTRLGGIEQ